MSLRDGFGSASRIQNTSSEQTVCATACYLNRIIVANPSGGHQTTTVKDGATTMFVLEVASKETVSVEFGYRHAESLKVTNSDATVDALVIFVQAD